MEAGAKFNRDKDMLTLKGPDVEALASDETRSIVRCSVSVLLS